MTIQELKKNITNLNDDFIIFVCEDNFFLADQYIKKISESKNLSYSYISSLAETQSSASSFINEFSPSINIIKTQTFSEVFDDYSVFKNCIVVCNKIAKEIKDKVETFAVIFPKLEDWQIKDYIKLTCAGLTKDEIDWLYTATSGNVYKIDTEIAKLSAFSKSEQKNILYEIKDDQYSDLFYFDPFYLSNAIMSNNKMNILTFFQYYYNNISPFLLSSSLLKEFKLILFVVFNSGLNASDLGISDGKFKFIKNTYRNISEDTVKKCISFLCTLDERIKTGQIECDDNILVDYIICNILILQNAR